MADFVQITVDDKAARATLERLGKVAAGDPDVMREVSLAAKQVIYNAFRFQQSPDGHPWPALASATLKARARKGNHSIQPLIATGAMYASIEAFHSANVAGVTMGDGLPDKRAWYNQHGTLTAPARPSFPTSDAGGWLDAVMAPVRKALEDATQ